MALEDITELELDDDFINRVPCIIDSPLDFVENLKGVEPRGFEDHWPREQDLKKEIETETDRERQKEGERGKKGNRDRERDRNREREGEERERLRE